MGAGIRRFSEMARQKLHVTTDKDFVPTPNTRNELMLKEAGEFAAHLKRCEQDIVNVKEATEALMDTTKIVFSAPLPRVYEDAGNGKASAVVPGNRPPGLIGGDFNSEEIGKITKDTGKKLDSEVIAPLQRWLTAYNTVLARMKKLEALRLEVDSRRRTVSGLGKKVEKQRTKLPQTRTKGEQDMENTLKTLQHKESKLTAARQTFKEHESIVYQQLAQLIRDAVWLKSYISAVLRLQQDFYAGAYQAVGPTQPALPMPIHDPIASIAAAPDHMGIAAGGKDMSIRVPSRKESGIPLGAPSSPPHHDNMYYEMPQAPTHPFAVAPPPPAAISAYEQYHSGGRYGQQPAW